MQEIKNTYKKQENTSEFAQLIGQLKPELMPLVRGYLHYLAEQEKQQKVERLLSSGDIWKANSTMEILSHQPVENELFEKYVSDIMEAFGEKRTFYNFHIFFAVYSAGIMDGVHRERERRRRFKHST